MGKRVIKRKGLNKDKLFWTAIITILLAIPIVNVYTIAILSESNIKLEQIKSDIKNQEKVNESLKMEISELSSLDKIQDIALENGLSYQNGNIKVVTSE